MGQFTQEITPPTYDESNPLFEFSPGGTFAERAKKMLSERLLMACNHCGSRLLIAKRLSGQVINCQQCKGEVHVPFVDDGEFDETYLQMAMPRSLMDATEMVSISSQRRRRELRRRQQNTSVMLVAAGVLLVVVLASILLFSRGNGDSDDNYQISGNMGKSVTKNPEAGTNQPKRPVRPKSKPLACQCSWYAQGEQRLLPAELGQVYLRVKVALTAGDTKMRVPTYGDTVKIRFSGKSYSSLGRPAKGTLLPVVAVKKFVDLAPRQSKDMTFLFKIPRSSRQGQLRIGSFPAIGINVKLPKPSMEFAGEFEEHASRALPLAKTHPVIAAIRKVPAHALKIQPRGGGYVVEFTKMRLRGQGQIKDGTCALTLRGDAGGELACSLELLPGGNELILHLGKSARHQIAFQRVIRIAPPAPVKPAPSAESARQEDRIVLPRTSREKKRGFFGIPID
ncbi:MAG: hypothetical protein HN909_09115 [Phycisphaerales bacterium]|nr:hypothetical protein [Phycisphaerales bacterium]